MKTSITSVLTAIIIGMFGLSIIPQLDDKSEPPPQAPQHQAATLDTPMMNVAPSARSFRPVQIDSYRAATPVQFESVPPQVPTDPVRLYDWYLSLAMMLGAGIFKIFKISPDKYGGIFSSTAVKATIAAIAIATIYSVSGLGSAITALFTLVSSLGLFTVAKSVSKIAAGNK